ncbi:uncharacterized protein LOC111438879 [Cucurbita moschata]|uniref:Uncharacterized protein LOC111438879 n=1 Tax=Cucurbita moschata TaxID=3662 RepID=A0A6J1F1T2_CUCMO|nr:uncharacterized protein LOC111438879 [Cucurbita moschata]
MKYSYRYISQGERVQACPYEHALYIKKSGGNVIFVALYVDDLIFLGNNDDEMIEEFKGTMTREFEMTDLGLLKFFLGLEVKQGETGIFISQETYAKEILKKYKMTNCNSISILMEPGAKLSKYDEGERVDANRYQSLVGSLCYLTCTRSDLSLSVYIISWFMEEPIYSHWRVLKRVLRYIEGTVSLELFYLKVEDYKLVGYFDNDLCGDIDNGKVHRVRTLLSEMKLKKLGAIVIQVDNKSTIELANNPVNHERSKHIDVRFHFIRDHVKEGSVELLHMAFAKKSRLPFTLLSDEGNKVRKEWGVPADLFGTLPRRQTHVLDKNGIVQLIYITNSNS